MRESQVSNFIVSITADSYLVEGIAPPISLYYRRVGGGVIIPGRQILCPSELVLIPPLLLANYNRYPLTDPTITPPTGLIPNNLVVASRIIVSIELNVRGTEGTRIHAYLARVTHVRGDGNLAVLQIDDTHPFNRGNPSLSSNGLRISNSISNGQSIQVVGYTQSNNATGALEAKSFNEGTVSLDYYMDPSGWIHTQLTLLSVAGVYNNMVGAAVLDDRDQLVGLVVSSPTGTVRLDEINNSANSGFIQAGLPHIYVSGEGCVAAIHYREIQLFLRAIECQYPLEAVDDVVNGTWERVLLGYMGIGYRQFKSTDYVDNIDFTGAITGTPGYEYPIDIINNEGRPNKTVNGILITSVAGDNTSLPSHMTPGPPQQGSDEFPLLIPPSPLLDEIVPGDQLISISYNTVSEDACIISPSTRYVTDLVGGTTSEIAPSLALSSLAPGDTITILTSNSQSTPKFSDQVETTFMLINRPAFLDFPYYAWHRCPNVPALPSGFEPSI